MKLRKFNSKTNHSIVLSLGKAGGVIDWLDEHKIEVLHVELSWRTPTIIVSPNRKLLDIANQKAKKYNECIGIINTPAGRVKRQGFEKGDCLVLWEIASH